jgi:hypothetical protein
MPGVGTKPRSGELLLWRGMQTRMRIASLFRLFRNLCCAVSSVYK